MNYLLIALLIYFIANKRENGLKDLLASIAIEDLIPLLPALGLSRETADLISNALPTFLGDKVDLPNLLKSILPLLSKFSNQPQSSEYGTPQKDLSTISDIAPKEVLNGLTDYFA